MKEIVIKSKIVGRGTETGPGRSVASIDLSAYALKSDLLKLETSFNDFLQGEDTDDVINRWKELETFLGGISESYNLLSILQGKADKATTLSGYGITDAYTKTNVDDLLKSYVTLGGTQTITGEKNFTGGLKVNGSPIVYDSTKKYWKLEGDLLVTGGITMYGNEGTYTPSTIMDAIAVDGISISKSGGVLKVIGGTGGGVADSVAWANITGKPNFASVATSGKYDDLIGKPTLLSSFTDDVVSGKYLPLSGGTLTDGLTISAGNLIVSGSDTVTNSLYPTKDNQYTLGNSSRYWSDIYTKLINGGTPWTSVNDGSGSGLDADLLDGRQPSELNVGSADVLAKSFSENINYGTFHSALKLIYNTQNDNYGFPNLYVSGLSVMAGYTGWQLMSYGGDIENPYFRSLQDTGAWKPWRQIAFLTDNVASATRLQTARTIWGQSFDGSSNVDGDFTQTKGGSYGGPYGGQNFYIYNKVTSDVSERYGVLRWAFDDYAAFRRLDLISKDFDVTNVIISFLHNGNVGIGTTNPSQKLHVLESSTYTAAKFETYAAQSVLTITKRDGISWALGVGIKDNGDSFGWWTTTGQRCAASIDVSGNFWVNGGITMYSDQRKKTILNHVELSLKQIAEAPLIEHYYNSDDKKTTHVGSIAQYWANMNDWFCKLDSEGYYTMEIQNAALASAISIARELDRYETKTDKAIKMLKKRICELEEEVERLKSA